MVHDILARTVLAPVLAAQAVTLVRRAPQLPEAEGPREGRIGLGRSLRLLFVGDSSAAGVGTATQRAAMSGTAVADLSQWFDVSWRLIARSGARTLDTIRTLEQVPPEGFDVAVLALGVNDVTHGVPVDLWIARQRRLAGLLKERFGVARVYASGLPPVERFPILPQPLRWVLAAQARRYDRRLRGLAQRFPGMVHIAPEFELRAEHMAEDGFHPGPQVYRAWGQQVARMIREDMG